MAVSENDLLVGPLVPASGVATISLDFFFERKEWLEVYKSGSDVALVLDTDYTVAGEGTDTGSITLAVAANGTDAYSVFLAVPLERSSDMQLRGEFKSGPFNLEMDRLWQRLQFHWTHIQRTVRLSATSSVSAIIASISPGQYLRFKEDGTGFEGIDPQVAVSDVDAWFQNRDATSALQGSLLTSGSVFYMNGLAYKTNSATSLADSATFDLGVAGVDPHGTITPQHFGPTEGVADVGAIIQRAVDYLHAAGGGVLFFPRGTYLVQTQIQWKSNVYYFGESKAALLKNNIATGGLRIFNQASEDVDNVVFDGLAFDGSINYPADSTVYKATLTNTTTAIRTSGIKATNITIKNCHFKKMAFGSIDINGFESRGIRIVDNTFYEGGYTWKTIGLRLPSGTYTDAQRVSEIVISRNILELSGPQLHYDPSKEDWIASADAIQLDSAKDAVISDNVISFAGGVGIRIEESLRVAVTGNRIVEPGMEGVTFYKNTYDCVCSGNSILNWGRIPMAYCIRNYGGTLVVPREFPKATGPTLPADPTASAWFDTWPYSTDGIDTGSIIAYSASDYYSGVSQGILPFRGYSAISVTNETEKILITNNAIFGNSDLDGNSKLEHACDFGIAMVHSVNGPTANGGRNCVVTGNSIVDTQQYRIYHPEHHDPIAASGLLGNAVYMGNRDSNSLIDDSNTRVSQSGKLVASESSDFLVNGIKFPASQVPSSDANTLDDYEEGLFTPTLTASASGTVTLSYDKLNYTKVGRQCSISGEIVVSAVSSPSGSIFLSLPFASAVSSERSARARFYVNLQSLTGSPSGVGIGAIESGASQAELAIENDFAVAGIASNIQVGTRCVFNFTYQTA